jgi:hypothetical protein
MIYLLLDIVAAVGEAFASWRFYLCVAIVATVIGAIYWWMPESPWRLPLEVGIGFVGLLGGIFWEWRAT